MPHLQWFKIFEMPQFSKSDGKMWQIKVSEHEKLSISGEKHAICFETGKEPKMNRLNSGGFQGKMQIRSNDEYLIHMIFGEFKVLYNIYNYLR